MAENEDFNYDDVEVDEENESLSGDTESDEGLQDQEDEPEVADQQDEETEEEDRKPKRVPRSQKRIKELIRQRNQERQEFATKYKEMADRLQQLEEKVTSSSSGTANFDAQIAQLEAQAQQAFDDADSEKFSAVNKKIRELERQKIVEEFKPKAKPKPIEPIQYQETPVLPDAAEDWIESNSKWFGVPGYEVYTQAADNLFNKYQADGYDTEDPALYKELNKTLKAIYPHLYYSTTKPAPKTGKTTVATGSKGVATTKPNDKSKLTKADLDAIRRYNFGDPNDPKVRADYLKYRNG